MAMFKKADASLIKPDINFSGWDMVRTAATKGRGKLASERDVNAAKVVLQEYDPKHFLLSHCTIIASVKTEQSNAPLGKSVVDGFQIERKYADWLITTDSSKYVNNNNDAWETRLLLSCYRTFIGGENYVEHIQIPEMSKGKIIDAAARDIGDSIYVDILVATQRKHRSLISMITSGQLQTLSMGCQVEFTLCSKCGNVAYDETQLCNHIRYFKGNDYVDELGRKRKIAELCGHINEEPGSVKFIEASWVANPAFTGAVLRNILSPEEISEIRSVGEKMQIAFSEPPRIPYSGQMARAASLLLAQDDQGDAPPPPSDDKGKDKKDDDPVGKAVEDMAALIRERALAKVRSEMGNAENSQLPDENLSNESLIKSALQDPTWQRIASFVRKVTPGSTGVLRDRHAQKMFVGMILYRHGGWAAVANSKKFSGREILGLSRLIDIATKRRLMAGESRIYRAVLSVGGLSKDGDVNRYLSECRQVLGHTPTDSERQALLVKARLFAMGS
jgi:hypothetical protein